MENETIEKTGEYSEQIDGATSLDFINLKKFLDNIDIEGGMENELYSPKFSAYLLNNLTGLASFQTTIHLNNHLKHGADGAKKLVKD